MRGSKDAISSTPLTPQPDKKSDREKGKHHASYKTGIRPPTVAAHFYSQARNLELFRKSNHIVQTKNVLFPRQTNLVSSSAGLTQTLLYPGKCG